MRRLVGIGTGPGDPSFLTLGAVQALKESDVIFVPHNNGKNMALDTVRDFIEGKEVCYLDFPMMEVTEAHYREGIRQIDSRIEEGGQGAFLTIGDPVIYSTFFNLLELWEEPSIEVSVISGVPSFIAAAGASLMPLVRKGERMLLCDQTEDIPDGIHSLSILKTGKNKRDTIELLEANGYDYKYIKRVSLAEETILENKEEILQDADYISLILARK